MRLNHYAVNSLELHMFFGRIMKEHAMFLRAGFTPADPQCAAEAEFYMKEFESILCQALELSNGNISQNVLNSGEIVTEFTCLAEKQTECLTGIDINRKITEETLCLTSSNGQPNVTQDLIRQIRVLNRKVLKNLDGLISFKETILKKVLQGEMFTGNYPLLIEHIIREAKLYRRYIDQLEKSGELSTTSMREVERFWNQIMMEHAQFIRGLLDPCETELIDTADDFSRKFCALLEASRSAYNKTVTELSLNETKKFRDFKAAGTKGIQECNVRSIILPLLADHVFREANHYIRLLKE